MAGMNPIMGGCSKGHTWWYDADGNICIDIQNCATCEKLTLKQLCGASIDGVELPIVDGIIQIPPAEEDKFGTVVDNGDGTGTVTDALGNACIVVKGPITQATVVDNGDGTATVTDSLGNSCVVVKGPLPPAVLSNIVNNGDGSATITQSDGTTKDVLCAGNDSIVDNGDGTSTITMPGGDVKIDAVCGVQSTVVDNGDGSATMTQNDGSTCDVVKAPLPPAVSSTVVDNGDGSATITQTDGTTKDVVCAPLPPAAASTVVDNGDGSGTVIQTDGTTKDFVCAPLPPAAASTVVDNGDGSATITQTDGSTKDVVCAPLPPAAAGSDTVNNNDGTHTITTADGVSTVVCLDPVKTINGATPDAAGNIDIGDIFSTTVDNGDGTYTTTNADGSTVTWSGDTFATGMSNGDGTATLTMADGSTLTLCEAPCPTLVDNGDGTASLSIGGTTITICLDPVKDVLDSEGNSLVVDGVATIPAVVTTGDTVSVMTDNGDGTWTHNDGAGTITTITSGNITDNGDGTATVTFPDGSTKDVMCAPLAQATVVDNGDGTGTVTDADGNACVLAKGPIVLPEGGSVSSVTDNGDGTWTHNDGLGVTTVITDTSGTVVDNGDGSGTVTFPDGTTCDFVKAPLNVPTLLRKDGTEYGAGDAVTPLNVDSVTDLARPIDGALGDKIIGQTATGDCNLFDVPAPNADGGSNLLAADGVTINPLLEHVTDRVIDVVADRLLTTLNISTAFTDGVSDADNPDCRTEIVCGADGKLYGPAPHCHESVRQGGGGTQRLLWADGDYVTGIDLGARGQQIDLREDVLCVTNPSPCRPAWLTMHMAGRIRVIGRFDDLPLTGSQTLNAWMMYSIDGGATWRDVQNAVHSANDVRETADGEGHNEIAPYMMAPGEEVCISTRFSMLETEQHPTGGHFDQVWYNMPSIVANITTKK